MKYINFSENQVDSSVVQIPENKEDDYAGKYEVSFGEDFPPFKYGDVSDPYVGRSSAITLKEISNNGQEPKILIFKPTFDKERHNLQMIQRYRLSASAADFFARDEDIGVPKVRYLTLKGGDDEEAIHFKQETGPHTS